MATTDENNPDPITQLAEIRKYIGDLSFHAPEIFPSGQSVQYRVGQILRMWD